MIIAKIDLKQLSQNFLISFGVFWLSLLPTSSFQRLNDGIRYYGDSLYSGIAMGVMTSVGRTIAAIVAGALVTLVASGRKPERWALVVAALYVLHAPRFHWEGPPTAFDRLWQCVNLLFPALACIVAAGVTARFRNRVGEVET